jgi:hypothetical protein
LRASHSKIGDNYLCNRKNQIMTETTANMGKPPIHSIVKFRVTGPQGKEFRRWINKEFTGWIRGEFKVKGFCDGRARCSGGEWLVSLEFTGPADAVLDRMAANFPALRFSFGHVCEVVGRRFSAGNCRVEYEFTDQNGVFWRGRNEQYAKDLGESQCAAPPRRWGDLLKSLVAATRGPGLAMPGSIDELPEPNPGARLRYVLRALSVSIARCAAPPCR